MPEMHRRAPQPNPIGARSLPAPPQRLTVSPPPPRLPDLLRAVGPWPWLEGLVPGGLHAGSDGVLRSLQLGHLHVGLVVGCRAWGLGGQRGSDSLCLPGL